MTSETSLNKLEYARLIETLLPYTSTYLGRRQAERLRPHDDRTRIEGWLRETEEARRLIERGARPPLPSLDGMEELSALLGTGYVLTETQLGQLALFCRSCGQLRSYMAGKAAEAGAVAAYAASMFDLEPLRAEIEACVDRGRIVDAASPELAKVRKKLRIVEEKLHRKLDALLSRHADQLQERLVSQRGGRYVLPVKKEHRRRIPGVVLDESASGQTVFVEPAETAGFVAELSALRAEEAREETQVLAQLTGLAEGYARELLINLETVGHYDFLFAKARWALAYGGAPVRLNEEGIVRLRGARHPLLPGDAVPLDVEFGETFRALLITGPNTGGKTVALKTIGLLTLMAQSGLLVPAAPGSELSVFRAVEADIGDDQSLDRSLSTFSSHLRRVIEILGQADGRTLVLLDELATGTDPGEGIGLSIAVLEELYRRGAIVAATTHFNEIKAYAQATPGFRNARMAFDEETLRPLYRLDMGEAGNSYAFVIARKLGIPERIVTRAREIADGLKGGGSAPPSPPSPPAPPPAWTVDVRRPRERERKPAAPPQHVPELQVGDVVWIPHLRRTGVVYWLPDERGNLIVQVQKHKMPMNHKRVTRYIEKSRLYPGEDYDLDIVFESVENRKKRKTMSKRHVDGLTIETPPEES